MYVKLTTEEEDQALAVLENSTKVLGVCWNPKRDVLTFIVSGLEELDFTRVGLFRKVAGLYDSLGIAAPLIFMVKIRLLMFGTRVLDWNDVVEKEDEDWWSRWLTICR